MISQPYEKKGRWYWTLDLSGPNQEELSRIPGLKVNEAESRVEGSVDAVSAAMGCVLGPRAHVPKGPNLKGILVPNSILRPYQQTGAGMLTSLLGEFRGAILADEMGLGKTRTTIAGVQALLVEASRPGGRTFVLCPAMVRETWAKELKAMQVPDEDVCILRPKPWRKRDRVAWEEQAQSARWVVTSYDLAPAAWNVAFRTSYPEVCILDEIHLLKGRSMGKRTHVRVQSLGDIIPLCTYKLGLSGTPMDDRPRDLWTPLSFILPGRFGRGYSRFDERYCAGRPGEHGGWDNKGRSNLEELALRLSYYMVRRTKAGVRPELPVTQHQMLYIDGDERGKVAFRTALLRQQQGDMEMALEATLEAKIPAAVELAQSLPDFFLVTKLRRHAQLMSEKLNKLDKKNVLVTGDSSPERRMTLIQQAASSHLSIVATADSCGLGVDGIQHVTTYGIRHAIEWRANVAEQQHERLGRGRPDPVIWYHLVCRDTADELVTEKNLNTLDDTRRVLGERGSAYREAMMNPVQDDAAHLKQLWDSIPDNFGEE